MIRRCTDLDSDTIWVIIHDGAQAYKGIIPADRWDEPYMSREKLQHEIDDGVVFWAWEQSGEVAGVMGLQRVQDVTLIRRLCPHREPEARQRGTSARSSARNSRHPNPHRDVGRRDLGHPLL